MLMKKIDTSEPGGGVTDDPFWALDKPLQVKLARSSFLMWA
jgi:hypothetical protein